MAVPKLIQPTSCSSVDRMLAKASLFFYGNVTNLSHDSWVKLSQQLYALKPEIKIYWPSWDTRKQLSCISSETLGISQLCDNLKSILKSSKGILYAE
ncbi:hypothetical protein Tco_0732448 [Tanacetum coccineum]